MTSESSVEDQHRQSLEDLPTIEQVIFRQADTTHPSISVYENGWSTSNHKPILFVTNPDIQDQPPGEKFALSHSLVSSGRFQDYS